MITEIKFCKDCRHCRLPLEYAKCLVSASPDHPEYLVYPESPAALLFCSTMRMSGAKCGPDGKLWEAKE